MDMKSQIRSAYVAGLCPHQLLLHYGPDSHRRCLPSTTDRAAADLPRQRSRWKRALLVVLILGLAIGTWQFLSRSDGTRATAASAEAAASGKDVLLLLLILALTIGAGELLSRTDQARTMTAAAEASASGPSVLRA
jgi:hypothetical protein